MLRQDDSFSGLLLYPPKLLSDALKGYSKDLTQQSMCLDRSLGSFPLDSLELDLSESRHPSLSAAGSSGLSVKQKTPRKIKPCLLKNNPGTPMVEKGEEDSFIIKFDNVYKRKNQVSEIESSKCLKRDDNTVVPSEPPQYQ